MPRPASAGSKPFATEDEEQEVRSQSRSDASSDFDDPSLWACPHDDEDDEEVPSPGMGDGIPWAAARVARTISTVSISTVGRDSFRPLRFLSADQILVELGMAASAATLEGDGKASDGGRRVGERLRKASKEVLERDDLFDGLPLGPEAIHQG